jgi:hypothetical protein
MKSVQAHKPRLHGSASAGHTAIFQAMVAALLLVFPLGSVYAVTLPTALSQRSINEVNLASSGSELHFGASGRNADRDGAWHEHHWSGDFDHHRGWDGEWREHHGIGRPEHDRDWGGERQHPDWDGGWALGFGWPYSEPWAWDWGPPDVAPPYASGYWYCAPAGQYYPRVLSCPRPWVWVPSAN